MQKHNGRLFQEFTVHDIALDDALLVFWDDRYLHFNCIFYRWSCSIQNYSFPMNIGIKWICLLYTSDAADEEDSVDLCGRRIIYKK